MYYSRKGGVLFSEIMLPENAPPGYADRETLWNAVEAAEKRDDAQLAYSFDIALQNEFTYKENLAIARQFMQENFASRGMIIDYAVHDSDKEPGGIPNPHFHVLIPMCPLNPNGTWGAKQKQVPVLDENGERVWDEKYHRYKFQAVHTTDWNTPETLEEWRKNWCDTVNALFEEKGLPQRIDHRSYERQGLDLLAQVHEGPAVRAMEKKGIPTQKGDFNRWVKAMNALIKSIREKLAGMMEWIKEAGMPDHYDPTVMEAWKRELAKLNREYNEEYARLKPIREDQWKLSHIQYCVDRVRKASGEPEIAQTEQKHETER